MCQPLSSRLGPVRVALGGALQQVIAEIGFNHV